MRGTMPKKEWVVRFACVTWFVWKQRNNAVFNNQLLDALLVATRCIEEMKLWLRY